MAVHNSKVSENHSFQVGIITVDPLQKSFDFCTNFEKTIDTINDNLINKFGGHLRIRKENGIRYLDYLKEYPNTNTQTIEFGKNLFDFTTSNDMSEYATVIVPLGSRLEESQNESFDSYVTVESVNHGSIYVCQTEALLTYGWIEKVVKWDDISDPSELLAKANEYLTGILYDNLEIELKAVDLHYMSSDIEDIKLLDQIRVFSLPHGLDRIFPVTKIEIPLDQPENTVFSIGYKNHNSDSTAQVINGLRQSEKNDNELSSRITKTNESITLEVTRASNAEGELSSRIEITAEQITSEVKRASEAEGELSSRITQTAESITAEVTRATEAEGELSGKIELTAESLTTEFKANIKEETDRAEKVEKELSSTITQTAESLTSTFTEKITIESDRAQEVEEQLSSTITQTAEQITSEVKRASEAEGELSSRITQTAESITSEIKRASDAEGELSSRITQTATSISSEITRAKNAESTLSTKITQTVNAIRLTVSEKTSGGETESTISVTNGTTTLNSIKITGTTAKQASSIVVDAINGIELSHTSSTSNGETTSTITLKNGNATIGTAKIVGTTATQAATIAADAVKGITLTVSNSTTGASSTLTLKSGSTTLSSGKIEFTGLVTFANLKDGKTEISGNNITTGKISADRIDVNKLKVDRVYVESTTTVALCATGDYYGTLYIGGSKGGSVIANTYLCASNQITFGSSWSSDKQLILNLSNRVLRPGSDGNYTGNTWYLGQSNYRFGGLWTYNLNTWGYNHLDGQLGFFGHNTSAKQSVTTLNSNVVAEVSSVKDKLNELIKALNTYGLV